MQISHAFLFLGLLIADFASCEISSTQKLCMQGEGDRSNSLDDSAADEMATLQVTLTSSRNETEGEAQGNQSQTPMSMADRNLTANASATIHTRGNHSPHVPHSKDSQVAEEIQPSSFSDMIYTEGGPTIVDQALLKGGIPGMGTRKRLKAFYMGILSKIDKTWLMLLLGSLVGSFFIILFAIFTGALTSGERVSEKCVAGLGGFVCSVVGLLALRVVLYA
mmetsp:Transcript_114812/g.202656  ORF Transcript_114812/g.202656 Transcript_114812/m.202656 type:complete len:221 (+) Transcript_114812:113-775(+)